MNNDVVGRYAPSPTGDLHLGNIRTAMLAWLQVRLQGGQFLLRIEDLDTPRVVEGSDNKILEDLNWLGIDWDGDVVYQSQRTHLYQKALEDLKEKGLVYPCFCSRKDIQQAASAPHGSGAYYPGTCRNLTEIEQKEKAQQKMPALRCRVNNDSLNAVISENIDDFVIKRADGLFAYQLAVVVDDLEQGVTHVLRGNDLLDSTARQQYLIKKLSSHSIQMSYTHVPLMLDESGQRMSKRDGSLSISEYKVKGYSANRLIGELAYSLKLVDEDKPITLDCLLNSLRNDGAFSFL